MIGFHTNPTSNAGKVRIMLEACILSHDVRAVDIIDGEKLATLIAIGSTV